MTWSSSQPLLSTNEDDEQVCKNAEEAEHLKERLTFRFIIFESGTALHQVFCRQARTKVGFAHTRQVSVVVLRTITLDQIKPELENKIEPVGLIRKLKRGGNETGVAVIVFVIVFRLILVVVAHFSLAIIWPACVLSLCF